MTYTKAGTEEVKQGIWFCLEPKAEPRPKTEHIKKSSKQ